MNKPLKYTLTIIGTLAAVLLFGYIVFVFMHV